MKFARVDFETKCSVAVQVDAGRWQLLDGISQTDWLVDSVVPDGLNVLQQLQSYSGREIDIAAAKFLPPVKRPEKIICVGKNYEQHAKEMGGDKPELPVIFNKLASCLIGDCQSIELPKVSQSVDYEGELVVVLGKAGRNISIDKAFDHVFGYTIGNDVTARDWQKGRPGGQWLLGKAIDGFAPLGPWIVTADQISDPHDLQIELTLNGRVMQQASTNEMIFRIHYLISHISQFFTWRPGDLLFTGTPAGVGAGRDPCVFLEPGDTVEVSIESVGKLKNFIV